MKKIIQLILFPVFLFVSCIGDNMDDCPATRTLIFKHHCLYDFDENFDNWVGNDVMLYVFQDKTLKMKEIIPYERIKDGKPYSYVKRYGGEIDIVAWSVPKGSTTGIPQYVLGDNFNDQRVAHKVGTTDYDPFPIDLYLGTDSLENDILTKPTTHTVRMIHCAHMVNITVEDPGNVMQKYTDKYILMSGVMDQMDLRYGGCGKDAVVCANVKGTSSFETGYFGVLPSNGNQNLCYTLYGDGKPLAEISTELKARPGSKIDFKIVLGLYVSVTVNGEVADWDVYTVNVKWM